MFLLLITSRIAIRLFFFNKILLFIKKLAFVVLKNNRFLLCLKKNAFTRYQLRIKNLEEESCKKDALGSFNRGGWVGYWKR